MRSFVLHARNYRAAMSRSAAFIRSSSIDTIPALDVIVISACAVNITSGSAR